MQRGILCALAVLLLPGCGLLRKLFTREKREEPPAKVEAGEGAPEAPVRLVGEIASIHPQEGFVLIHRHAQGRFVAGDLLAAMGPDGRTASLRLTGEQLGRYFAADIQEGTPQKGDLIIARRLPESSFPPSTPVRPTLPEAQNAPGMKKSSEP